MIHRRLLLCSAPALLGSHALAQTVPAAKKIDKGPPLPLDLVKEFVGAAHGKFDRTKELLAETPGLLNATWDWGGGDFETGLGGASHMGNKEIALYLIGQGARVDIFAAAMLGKLDVVKAMCTAMPGIHRSLGPHKITLLAHAKRGGANEVAEYLERLDKASE